MSIKLKVWAESAHILDQGRGKNLIGLKLVERVDFQGDINKDVFVRDKIGLKGVKDLIDMKGLAVDQEALLWVHIFKINQKY